MLRFALTARDRYRAYVKARRAATNGSLVICDRYPLPILKMTDGPVLGQVIDTGVRNWFVRWLQRAESHYYAQIMLPELLIVLRIKPEIAVQRRSDEDPAWVRMRCQEICDADWQQTPAYVIDAERSKEEVLSELKSLVWSHL
jgi:thymidylate kinase